VKVGLQAAVHAKIHIRRKETSNGTRKLIDAPNHTRRIAVLGAGAWGTALANLAARPAARMRPKSRSGARPRTCRRDDRHRSQCAVSSWRAAPLECPPRRGPSRGQAQSSFSPWSRASAAAGPGNFRATCGGWRSHRCLRQGYRARNRTFPKRSRREILPGNPPAILSGRALPRGSQGLPTPSLWPRMTANSQPRSPACWRRPPSGSIPHPM